MFVSDALHILEQNTERINGGSHHTKRYTEILEDIRNPKPVETSEEIIERFNSFFLRNEEDDPEDDS